MTSQRVCRLVFCGSLVALQCGCASRRTSSELAPTRIDRRDIQHVITLNGVAFPSRRTSVWPTVSGRVTRVFVDRGDTVRAGQPLLQLDDVRAQRDVTAKELAFLRAQVAQRKAKAAHTDEATDQLERQIAEIDIAQARQALEDAHAALGEYILRSPRDGVVVQMNVQAGQIITPGTVDSSSYLAIADTSGTQIEVEGDEFEVAGIAPGMKGTVHVDAADISLDATVDSTPALMRVRNPGLSASQYLVRLTSGAMLPVRAWGMTARVSIAVAFRSNVSAVPLDSIVRYRQRLYVVDAKSGHAQVVSTGLCVPDACELVSGPPVGTFILRGNAMLLERQTERSSHAE
jgi:HlyD family secretion protein